MRMTLHTTLTLLSVTLASLCVMPPRSIAAQTAPARLDMSALTAAIEEAHRSPFHGRNVTDASLVPHLSGYLPTHSLQDASQTPAADDRPSYLKVLVPTLAVTYLADFVGIWAAICWGYGGGGGCIDNEAINLALWVTVPVIVPAVTAGGIADRIVPGFLGSALGTAAAVVSLRAIDPEGPGVWILPAIDAVVTTFVTLALPLERN